ncbi:unnamed protein product [marine sediment metagenome]|uniref:Uncharacterized protein n=1 Tax=marine sediment metagenome TaxID=412755 RepID=X1TR64_9ZZZZ
MRNNIEINTVVSPAKFKKYKDRLFREKVWTSISIKTDKKGKLEYFAIYEVMPIGKIRWAGEIKNIEKSNENPGKYDIYLKGIAKIGPIRYDHKKQNIIRRSRYTNYELLKKAKTLSDIF